MKQLIIYQWVNRLLYISFSFIIPVFIINSKYDLVDNRNSLAIKGGFLIIAFLTIRFGNFHFKRMIEKMKDSYLKRFIQQFFHVLPYGLIFLIILYTETHLQTFKYVTKWIFVSMLIAIIFDLMGVYYRDKIDKLKGVR